MTNSMVSVSPPMISVLDRLCQKALSWKRSMYCSEAHKFELEAAGIEAAPEREDGGIERDGEQIDDGRRHEEIGECLAHERAAAPRCRAE
jgi:hypothetical protein